MTLYNDLITLQRTGRIHYPQVGTFDMNGPLEMFGAVRYIVKSYMDNEILDRAIEGEETIIESVDRLWKARRYALRFSKHEENMEISDLHRLIGSPTNLVVRIRECLWDRLMIPGPFHKPVEEASFIDTTIELLGFKK